MEGSTTPKSARVLRAADVIPPFEGDNASSGNQTNRDSLPTFDLADSILAEQRRIASGRRRRAHSVAGQGTGERAPACAGASLALRRQGNGRMGEASPLHPVAARLSSPKSVSPIPPCDVAELHEIVAGIVSRDIERLCAGPSMAL